MKATEAEVKSLIAAQIWEALEKARRNGEEASDYEIVCEDGEICIQRADVYNNDDAIVSAENMADVEEYSDRESIEAWVGAVFSPSGLQEIGLKLLDIGETENIAELQEIAESTKWWELSDEEAHKRMIEMLKHGISLLTWNLDTVQKNCIELNEIAEYDHGEISAMFFDSLEGGPLARKESDMFSIRVDGLDLCGLKYGTKYNDDGALVLDWVAGALGLPEPAWREYQDGWREDSWNLADIEK